VRTRMPGGVGGRGMKTPFLSLLCAYAHRVFLMPSMFVCLFTDNRKTLGKIELTTGFIFFINR
jgi:hypothetical protein